MCQVNGGGSFLAQGSKTPELIQMKFNLFNYIHCLTPHAKYGGHRERGMGWEVDEVVPLCVFFPVS